MEPMLLRAVGKDYLWGGTRLKNEYDKGIDLTPLAETWECSTHPDGSSIIASGRHRGDTLDAVLRAHPEYMGTKAHDRFPILVKLIDAEQKLSVQVHPSDAFAQEHENQNGKTEMWYVLDAKPGANLVCGFAHDMTPGILKNAIETDTLEKHLKRIPVHKGDVFYIPAGTVHAIGAGALIAEIQENSNVTYRVYDYNRRDRNGSLRELHFDKAVQVLDMKAANDVRQKPRKVNYCRGCAREILCRCSYFEVERIQVNFGFDFSVLETSFQVLLCIDGEGSVQTDDRPQPLHFRKGDCLFIPAGAGRCHLHGKCELLKIRC